MNSLRANGIRVFSTSPQSKDVPRAEYVDRLLEVARWSEAAGCEGMLVYTDNGLVDPWLLAQLILQGTEHLSPLVAVQPVYMHPYAAAKMVATLAHLHGRKLHVNMVAGGFRNDLAALDDETPHDDRYDRVVEYAQIMKALLSSPAPVTFDGHYYTVQNLKMRPPVSPELEPAFMISGSSPAGAAAARKLGAVAVRYPKPPGEEQVSVADGPLENGCRVGVIARESDQEAWRVALDRFPPDRRGELTHHLAMSISDSRWHEQLSDARWGDAPGATYWLGPFRRYKTFCPYLVGSYARVGAELAKYMSNGFRLFILDIPPSLEELEHTGVAFESALATESQ